MQNFQIGRRELYILPTRVGWYFSLILIALFAIAVKFSNQAAFMMLFILASIGNIAMLYTHNNVIGLKLEGGPAKPVFVGELIRFPVKVTNPSNKFRHAVWLVADGYHRLLELEPDAEQEFQLEQLSFARGLQPCAPIILTSQFPIGIFFCWSKRFESEQKCLVYPAPLDLHPLPIGQSGNAELNHSASRVPTSQDFHGMKPYQEGDRLRDIHWPSLAKTNKLVTIEYESHKSDAVNLSWFALPGNLSLEDKLSQLCHWIIEADRSGLRYQLEMPNHTIQYDRGSNHYHKCLTVLALWE